MTDRRTVAIIQARMASSRLPGKVLQDIGGEPMLVRVVERVRRARLVHAVGVATTTDPSDDPVAELCQARGYPLWRGSQFDVLDRYYRAAVQFGADVIVRVTADCPVIDPDVIDQTVQAFFDAGVDFAANRLPPPGSGPFRLDWTPKSFLFRLLNEPGKRRWRSTSASMSCRIFMMKKAVFASGLSIHSQIMAACAGRSIRLKTLNFCA
jgi:hypothetical protein